MMGEGIRCSTLITPSLRKVRKRVLRAVEQEASGERRTQGSTFPPVITEQVLNLHWRRQSARTTNDVVGLTRRMVIQALHAVSPWSWTLQSPARYRGSVQHRRCTC